MIQRKMGRTAYIKSELERLRQRAAAAAEAIHTKPTPLADPELEGCSGLRTKEKDFDSHINDLIDKALKDIEMLGLAEQEKKEEEEKEQDQREEEEKTEEEVLEAEMMILRRVDTGFEKWLSGLTEVELEKVVRRVMKTMAMRKQPFSTLSACGPWRVW